MAYDGSIRINTKIDGKGFNSGIKMMMSSLGGLAAALGVAFSVAGMVNFGKKSVETAMQMEAGWQGLRYMANAYGKDLGHINEFLKEYTEDGLVPMMNAQQAYKNMLARGYSTDQLEKMLLIMKDSSVYLRKGQLSIGDAIEKTTMGLRTERSILTDSAGIEKNMYKMWQAYAKEMGTTISALTHEQKLIAEFQGFMEEGAIYADAAAEYTQTYAAKVAQLTAAMVGLKVSVGNMIIPLLNAILPKIIAMVKWFTYWFNIIGRVMNLLFGTQVGASSLDGVADSTYEAADAQDELANATEGAGKAAKGALASFDKLNVLQKPAEGGGAGGEISLPEEEGFFDEVDAGFDALEEKIQKFKNSLDMILWHIRESFKTGDFGYLASVLSTGIVNALTNAREAIQNFDFKTFGSGIGSRIGTAISTFFHGTDWVGLFGQTAGLIGDALIGLLDTVTGFLIGFVTSIDWSGVGTTVWDSIVAFFTEIDWEGIAESLAGFLGAAFGAAFLLIGKLTDVILEIQDALWKWFDESVLQYFRDKIEEAGGDVWKGFLRGIQDALVGIGVWLLEHVLEPFIKGFKDAFGIASPSTVMEEQGGYIIDGLKEGIANAWINIKAWFDEKVLTPLKEWFGKAWEDIKTGAETAWNGITEVWQTVKDWFDAKVITPLKVIFTAVWLTIKSVVSSAWDGIKELWQGAKDWFTDEVLDPIKEGFTSVWQDISDAIKGVINGIIGFVNGMIQGIVSGINSIIGVLNKLHFDIPDWIPGLGGNSFGFNIATISAPQIPLLATGAVIPANAPFAAILGDQRSGINIETPERLLRDLIRDELGRNQPVQDTIHNVIKLDGQVLYDAFKKVDKRVGRSMVAGSGIR